MPPFLLELSLTVPLHAGDFVPQPADVPVCANPSVRKYRDLKTVCTYNVLLHFAEFLRDILIQHSPYLISRLLQVTCLIGTCAAGPQIHFTEWRLFRRRILLHLN